MKPTILFVVEAFGGGVFSFLEALINKISDKYNIVVFFAVRPQTPQNIERFFTDKVTFVKSNYMGREIRPYKDLQAIHELRDVIKHYNPALIHLNSSKAGAIGRLAAVGRNIPVVYSPHGFSFLMHNKSLIGRAVLFGIEWILARLSGEIVGCGRGEFLAAKKLSRDAIEIDNGVDVTYIDSLTSLRPSGVKNNRVFTLGRITAQKNPKLFNKIALKFPQIHFDWIGDGEDCELLTAPNIQIHGWVPREDALKLASQSNIFLLTSEWEGLPISLLEAMLMRKTCIVSNVSGNRDVIQNGVNGFVCSSEDDFFRAMKSAISTDTKLLTSRAELDVRSAYSIDEMCHKYCRLYSNLMSSGD